MKIGWKAILVGVALLFLLAQGALAMSSTDYRLDWLNLLSGSGGSARSAGYSAGLTVGQTVSYTSSSPLYRVQMGFWAGIPPELHVMLPIIRDSP